MNINNLIAKTKEVWSTNIELHKAMDEENWVEVLRNLPPAELNDTSDKVAVGGKWTIFALENNLVKLPEEVAEKLISQSEDVLSQFE